MAVFSIQCPECNAVLKSSKQVPAGKQITCPKCDVMFIAPAPRPAKQVVQEVEVVEDEYDAVEIIDESAAKKTAVAAKPKRRRPREEFKKKTNPWPLILGITGGILGVAVLAVGGYFAVKFVSFSRSGEPLAYLPENPGIIMGADLEQLMSNPQLGPSIEAGLNAIPQLALYKQASNIDFKSSLEKIVVGLGQIVGGQPGTITIAFNSKSTLNKEQLAKAMDATAASVGGRNAFENKAGLPFQKQVLLVPTNNLAALYMGRPNTLDDNVRMGGKAMPKPDTEKMLKKASEGHVWLVLDLAIPGIRDQLSTNGPMATPASRDMLNNMTCIGMWAKIMDSDIEIAMHFLTPTPEAAKTLSDQMQKEQKAQKSNLMMQAAVMAIGGMAAQKDIQESEKYDIDGTTVTYTARLKLDNLKTLIDQASRLQNMLPNMGGGNDPRGGRGR